MAKQLIKTEYIPAYRAEPDIFMLVYRDTDTGEKITECIERPNIRFFVAKPEQWDDDRTVMSSRPRADVDERRAPYREILQHVAAITGRSAELEMLGRAQCRHLHHTNNVLCSDFDIQDIGIDDFLSDNDWTKIRPLWLKLAFFDIEVDVFNYTGFPSEFVAPCPINLITYYRTWSGELMVYINEANNREMTAFCRDPERVNALTKRLEDRFTKQMRRPVRVHLVICGDESNLLQTWVSHVQNDSPDFISAWNARYDIMTIENRMLRLGLDPIAIYGNPMLPRWWQHRLDERATMPEQRVDTFSTPTPWTFLDLMTCYTQVRKGTKKEDNYRLETIATKHLKYTKEDMRTYGNDVNMHNFSRRSPEGFITYGGQDTLLLDMLNTLNKDIDFLYQLSLITRTRINSVFYKTVMIRNFYRVLLRDAFDRILCNNHNTTNESKTRFRGAYVADPLKNLPYGVDLGGMTRSQFIYENVVDMDFSSMYPSIIRALNICPDALVGFMCDDHGSIDRPAHATQLLVTRDPVAIARDLGRVDPLKHLARLVKHGEEWLLNH